MRIPIANPSHSVHILVLETSAGLIMSKANEKQLLIRLNNWKYTTNGISGYATVCFNKKEEILQVCLPRTLAQWQP